MGAGGAHPRHQARPGIGHGRRAGVGDERDLLAIGDEFDELSGRSLFIVLMHRQHAAAQAEGIEQALAVARVLSSHHIHRAQHGERTQRNVMQITERRSHHIQ